MNDQNHLNSQNGPPSTTFADFMYAVVVGVAFSDIHLFDKASGFQSIFVTIFLLVVVLEDFYLYQTEVKPYTNVFKFKGFSSFFFEVSILLCWYIAFAGRIEARVGSLLALAAFFFLKWAASAKHVLKGRTSWIIHRDHLFWITIIMAIAIAIKHIPCVVQVGHGTLAADWAVVAVAWLLQTVLWWTVVAQHE